MSFETPLCPVHREEPGRERLIRLLDALPSPPAGTTLIIARGATDEEILRPNSLPGLRATLESLRTRYNGFGSGLVLFWSLDLAFSVRPPLPPETTSQFEGWDIGPLLDLLGRPYTLGIFLLRRGGYTTGIFEGDMLVDSKTGTRFVKNRHRKGGQSQRRFDRIREKQVGQLFEAACEVARTRLEPFSSRLDALFLGGDRRTVQVFLAQCRYLSEFGPRLQTRFLNVPEPRQQTLQLAYDMIWRSDWLELREQPIQTTADPLPNRQASELDGDER